MQLAGESGALKTSQIQVAKAIVAQEGIAGLYQVAPQRQTATSTCNYRGAI